MRQITVTIRKFSELSPDAKEKAKNDWAAIGGYMHSDEAMESIKALASHFDGEVSDLSIDWFGGYSSMSFDMPDDMTKAEIKRRLSSLGSYNKHTGRGDGECKLTGYCMDEDAIDGFRLAWRRGERDLTKLMDAAFKTWLKAAQADCEDEYSDETFSEFCDANNYEFHENGALYRRER